MEKITIKLFKEYLFKLTSMVVVYKNNEYTICPNISLKLSLSESSATPTLHGFYLNDILYNNVDELLSKITDCNEIVIKEIDGFNSLKSYEFYCELQKQDLKMEDLINRYKSCNIMSLIGYMKTFNFLGVIDGKSSVANNEMYKKEKLNIPDDKIIERIKNIPELFNNFLKYEITNKTYNTSGPTQIIYFFKFNDETKQYLLKFENDYSLNKDLEDLAFYIDNKIIFSSCTHEQYRIDYRLSKK